MVTAVAPIEDHSGVQCHSGDHSGDNSGVQCHSGDYSGGCSGDLNGGVVDHNGGFGDHNGGFGDTAGLGGWRFRRLEDPCSLRLWGRSQK